MTVVESAPAGTAIALLADLDPTSHAPDRIHAVLGWTDLGERHYQPLAIPVAAATCTGIVPPARVAEPSPAVQLHLDVEGLDTVPPTSSGRTWRTWALPSIPPTLRHLQLAAAVRELATQLGG